MNLKSSSCLSVRCGGPQGCHPSWVFSFLDCHLPPVAFLCVMEETFLSLLFGEIEAGPAGWMPCMHRLRCCVPLVE